MSNPLLDEQNLSEAVGRLLAEPPAGTPGEVIELLGAALGDGPLPTRVFLQAVEQAPLAISITDTEAHIQYINPAFSEVTGYPAAELIGQRPAMLSARQTPHSQYRELWQTISAGQTWNGTLVNRRKDGTRYLAGITISPVLGRNGEIQHYLGLQRDITEIHRVQQELRNKKALIEGVVDAAPAVVALVDQQRRILLDNQAYKKLLGDMRGAEPAHYFLDAVGLDPSAGDAAPLRDFGPTEVRFEPGPSREPQWFLVSGSWVDEGDTSADHYFEPARHRALLLVARDISAQKREQERGRMLMVRARMAEAELTQGMHETLSGAIFQLQQPMNVARSAHDMLARRGANGDPLAQLFGDFLQHAEAAIERMHAALPKQAAEPYVPVNLNQLLVDVLQLSTESMLASGITVDWAPAPVIPSMPGQPQRLRLAIRQLIDNAITAMSARGWQRRDLKVRSVVRDGSVELVIEDSGPGIDATERTSVFEPFFSGWPDASQRRGMGLAQVQEVMTDHGGGVEIGEASGGGCRVTLYLPQHPRGQS